MPIRVPERVAIVGDELRSVRVEPAGSLTNSGDTTYSLAGITHMKSIIDDILEGNAITKQTEWTAEPGATKVITPRKLRKVAVTQIRRTRIQKMLSLCG